jgi:hypothetical protein
VSKVVAEGRENVEAVETVEPMAAAVDTAVDTVDNRLPVVEAGVAMYVGSVKVRRDLNWGQVPVRGRL